LVATQIATGFLRRTYFLKNNPSISYGLKKQEESTGKVNVISHSPFFLYQFTKLKKKKKENQEKI
jgi:hypothetical protein